jgi:hypothetical protein
MFFLSKVPNFKCLRMRINLFEFEDIRGFPGFLRDAMTDYLRYILTMLKIYDAAVPKINEILYKSKMNRIVDMCSGGGGAIEAIYKSLLKKKPTLEIILTDLYPNIGSFELLKSRTNGQIEYCHEPVNATRMPSNLNGVRTMFSAFHHFSPGKAKEILLNAIAQKQPIAIFDGGEKNLLMIFGLILFHPLFLFLLTPFIKPFKWLRIFFTYFIPMIPLCTVWDGIASILKLYSPEQMQVLARDVNNGTYVWESGIIRGKSGLKIYYLTGRPLNN